MVRKAQKAAKRLFGPFFVIWRNPVYMLWLIMIIFFGCLNIFVPWFINPTSLEDLFHTGVLYSYALALLVPNIVEFFIDVHEKKRLKKEQLFIGYKIPVLIFEFIFCLLIPFLLAGRFSQSIFLQLFCVFFTIYFVFFIYCTHAMESDADFYYLDELSYHEEENKNMSKTEDKARELTVVETGEGIIEV